MNYWAENAKNFTENGVLWSPEIYPGSSTAHRDHKVPGSKGEFFFSFFSCDHMTEYSTILMIFINDYIMI